MYGLFFFMFFVSPFTKKKDFCSVPPLYVLPCGKVHNYSDVRHKSVGGKRVESRQNETGVQTDVRASNISDSGISLKAISLIIHIDYF